MELEKEIIIRYKKKFPHETLKETSERTGIQITRVFRLFSGRKMKVSELEAFRQAIERETSCIHQEKLKKIMGEMLLNFDNEEIEFACQYLERKLQNHQFNQSHMQPDFSQELIA